MTHLHSSVQTKKRIGLKEMLCKIEATHILTLAFHEQINMDRATGKISRWHKDTMHRVFGRRCFELPAEQTIEFLLLPEAGHANLHFHGVIRVPPTHLARFENYALPHWKRIAQKGTHDFQLIRQTDDERDQWFNYITKSTLAETVFHSSMVHGYPEPSLSIAPAVDYQIPNQILTKPVSSKALHEPVLTSTRNGIGNY